MATASIGGLKVNSQLINPQKLTPGMPTYNQISALTAPAAAPQTTSYQQIYDLTRPTGTATPASVDANDAYAFDNNTAALQQTPEQIAAAQAAATAQNQYHTGLSAIQGGSTDAFNSLQSSLQGSAQNLFNSFRTGQQGIDNSRANNELNRQSGIADIVSYVRNGLRQGQARLANGNALDSSATGALGQAYSQVGNQKSRGVNNQAAIQSNQLDQSQNELNLTRDNGVNDFHRVRDQQVNAISTDLRNKLAALDQQAQGLSIPDRVAVEQEKQRLVDEGVSQLQGVDSWLQSQLATVNPQNQDQVIAAANNLRTAGTAAPNPFNTGTFDPLAVQGPAIDQLPIFVARKSRAT